MRLWKNSRKSRRSMMRAPQQSSKDAQLRQILADVLHEREMAKLDKLLSVREDESLTKVLKNLVKVVPNSVKKKHCVTKDVVDRIVSINREGQYVVINLKEGLQLATFPSRQQYRNYYYCFRDYLPQDLTPESYQAAHDIGFRLDAGDQTVSSLIRKGLFIPSETASIIECGAYNSWKAIGFSKHIGEKGKVLVLEIDQEQYELARLNLRRNLSEQEFKIMHTGVWHCREERTYTYEHYASHTLNTPDQHSHHSQTSLVKTDTLDNIIDESGIEVFDFINIQTGGSEYESLQGLSRNLNRVKVMWVGSHYTNEGISSRWKSIKLLLEQGCCIYAKKGFEKIHSISEVRQDETGGFYAVTPQYSNILIPTER